MITAIGLTRRETLLLGAAAFASTIARPAVAQEGPERHGMSAFGDLKYPAVFKHFDYVNPNAPKGGVFSHVGSNRVFNQNFLTFDSLASATEARAALGSASRVLKELGANINPQKTRIVHVRHGFEFLGYKIKRGGRPMRLPTSKIRTRARPGALYAFPREKSIRHFRDQIRRLTRRNAPVSTQELIKQVNPVVRGWGHHYKRAHVRKLFHQLDGWLVRRIWSHRFGKWRCCEESVFVKAGCGKTARPVCAADGGQRESNRARLLRPDSWEAGERCGAIRRGAGGAKGRGQGEREPAQHAPDTGTGARVTSAGAHTASCKTSASPSLTQGGSRVREFRSHGSERGAIRKPFGLSLPVLPQGVIRKHSLDLPIGLSHRLRDQSVVSSPPLHG
jgi:hypothetical protein